MLNIIGVLIHKSEHFEEETFVVAGEMKPGGAVHRHNCGQVIVIIVGAPGDKSLGSNTEQTVAKPRKPT